MNYYVYLLSCVDDSIYCDWTTDPIDELTKHNSGCGTKYTKYKNPVKMIYLEQVTDKLQALSRTFDFKHMTRKTKLGFIDADINLLKNKTLLELREEGVIK